MGWRNQLLRQMLDGNTYQGLNADNVGAELFKRFRIYDELSATVNDVSQKSQLMIREIGGITVLDRIGDIVGQGYWGKDVFWPDFLDIRVYTKERYSDIFRFSGVTRIVPVKGREVWVFYDSKQANIRKVQEFYNISDAEARKRINEWLPALLLTAKELYVTPPVLPSEKWLPSNLPGKPNPQYIKLYTR